MCDSDCEDNHPEEVHEEEPEEELPKPGGIDSPLSDAILVRWATLIGDAQAVKTLLQKDAIKEEWGHSISASKANLFAPGKGAATDVRGEPTPEQRKHIVLVMPLVCMATLLGNGTMVRAMLSVNKDLLYDHELLLSAGKAATSGKGSEGRAAYQRDCCITTQTGVKYTALALACYFGHTTVVKALLEGGAEVNPQVWKEKSAEEKPSPYVSPLHCAAAGGFISIIEALVDAGADVDATNAAGWSVFGSAAAGLRPHITDISDAFEQLLPVQFQTVIQNSGFLEGAGIRPWPHTQISAKAALNVVDLMACPSSPARTFEYFVRLHNRAKDKPVDAAMYQHFMLYAIQWHNAPAIEYLLPLAFPPSAPPATAARLQFLPLLRSLGEKKLQEMRRAGLHFLLRPKGIVFFQLLLWPAAMLVRLINAFPDDVIRIGLMINAHAALLPRGSTNTEAFFTGEPFKAVESALGGLISMIARDAAQLHQGLEKHPAVLQSNELLNSVIEAINGGRTQTLQRSTQGAIAATAFLPTPGLMYDIKCMLKPKAASQEPFDAHASVVADAKSFEEEFVFALDERRHSLASAIQHSFKLVADPKWWVDYAKECMDVWRNSNADILANRDPVAEFDKATIVELRTAAVEFDLPSKHDLTAPKRESSAGLIRLLAILVVILAIILGLFLGMRT